MDGGYRDVGERPKTETWTTSALPEVKHYIDTGEFGYGDGRIVTLYTTDRRRLLKSRDA